MTSPILQAAYEEMLVREAGELLRKYCSDGPPFDPRLVASRLGVEVIYETLAEGVEGYSEHRGGKFFAIVSNRAPYVRQRFTLAHELGHIQLMAVARKGFQLNLVRFRAQKWAELLHQDPIEEKLCNAFAAELLMPADRLEEKLSHSRLGPKVIFDIAAEFRVSIQATARRVVRLLGSDRTGCSLWKVTKDGWSLPVWWTGLSAEGRDLKKMTSLVFDAAENKTELAQGWQWTKTKRSRSWRIPKDSRVIVQIAPTYKAQHFLAFVGYRSGILNHSTSLHSARVVKRENERGMATKQQQLQLPFI